MQVFTLNNIFNLQKQNQGDNDGSATQLRIILSFLGS